MQENNKNASASKTTKKESFQAVDLAFTVDAKFDTSILNSIDSLENELTTIVDSVNEKGEKVAFSHIMSIVYDIQLKRQSLNNEQDKILKEKFSKTIIPIIKDSEFCDYSREQPRGYPGDFKMMEMIWKGRTNPAEHRYRGKNKQGKLINALTLDMKNCLANEERVHILSEFISCNSASRLATVGSGSCLELEQLMAKKKLNINEIHMFDQDEGALELSKDKLRESNATIVVHQGNILRSILKIQDKYDLIYSSGLFDYFSMESAKKLINKLWDALNPGGKLCIINANPANPSKLWMELCLDWNLEYKEMNALSQLAESLDNIANLELKKDSQKIYQYYTITKDS